MKTSCYRAIAPSTKAIVIDRLSWKVKRLYPNLFKPLVPRVEADSPKEFAIAYQEQLSELDPKEIWGELHAIAKGGEPILLANKAIPRLFANRPARSLPSSLFSHRRLVAEWFERELGVAVPEIPLSHQSIQDAQIVSCDLKVMAPYLWELRNFFSSEELSEFSCNWRVAVKLLRTLEDGKPHLRIDREIEEKQRITSRVLLALSEALEEKEVGAIVSTSQGHQLFLA